MTNTQLYLAIGIPILFNGILISWLRSDINNFKKEMREDIKTIMSKLADLDNRLTRVEERLGIKP